MDPVARFCELVDPARPRVPLGEAALLIAACAHPGLDLERWTAELDTLADGLPPGDLVAVRRRMYVECGFAGNTVDYYDPRNSFLDDVLTRRTGIPITLAVVFTELARRAGVDVVGVSMPAHFLVRAADDPNVFVDPFDGVPLDRDGCRRLYHRVAGDAAMFDPAFLEPAPDRAVVARMLANLRAIYAATHDMVNLAWVLRLRLALPGASEEERLELTRALAAGGRPGEAADELLAMAAAAGDDERAAALTREAARLRARLN